MKRFWDQLSEWSQATFGNDYKRGPRGPLLHLKKEVDEAINEMDRDPYSTEKLFEEIVDCQFLVFDAARRAGLNYAEFWVRVFEKLKINRNRTWGPPSKNEPVEHKRE